MDNSHQSNQITPTVAIVGARGLVGSEALAILKELGWPADSIRVFGSSQSHGTIMHYNSTELVIESVESIVQDPPEYALLCADKTTAFDVTQRLSGSATRIIDNSSAFRLHPDVPLVIPEVNAGMLRQKNRVISNPNCSTIMMLTAVNPLRAACGIRSLQVATYQAVSGAGRLGLETLHDQTRAKLLGNGIPKGTFPVSCAFDVFEHESEIDAETGFNGEESKMIAESKKIWELSELSILPTCVRVPVERAHAQSITVELDQTVSVDTVQNLLRQAPGVRLVEKGTHLTPASIAGRDEVFVGRVRIDPDDARRVILWVCCDQIRKGAALNAIQIMQQLIEIRSSDGYSPTNGSETNVTDTSGYACLS